MTQFNWLNASGTLSGFGGEHSELFVEKTGLPFFDALRLYGTIDLFVGLRDKVSITDMGTKWKISAQVRAHFAADTGDKIRRTASALSAELTKNEQASIIQLECAVRGGDWPLGPFRNVSAPLDNPDSALKDGIRGIAASTYKGLETGFGKDSRVSFSDALLALAGQKRSESVASISFLPIFEGVIDYSKVVSPLRAWSGIPNVLCAQALMLLALKTSLFAEGYAPRLSAVAYNTDMDARKHFNYSGVIGIQSTVLGKVDSVFEHPASGALFVDHFYRSFRSLISRAWTREGGGYKATEEVEDALAHAAWIMQPVPHKHLSSLVASLERQKKNNIPTIVDSGFPKYESYVKEIFQMSKSWSGDHDAVRKFAKAVASGIYYARPVDDKKSIKEQREERQKNWYDEVTMLRSAPRPKAFKERALILIEQGKRENALLGSELRGEDFDPLSLLSPETMGNSQAEFEAFRDLFRMYLILESKPFKINSTDQAALPETADEEPGAQINNGGGGE